MDYKYILPLGLVLFFLSFRPSGAFASEEFDQADIRVGVDIGGGNVKSSVNGNNENDSALYLGFRVLYRADPNYLIGLELSGWTLGSGNLWDPSKGEAISQVFFVTQYYPKVDSGLFLKAGGGYASYWSNQPGESGRKSGSGFTLGGGYDYSIQNDWTLTPFVSFGIAKFDRDDRNGWALGVGLSNNF